MIAPARAPRRRRDDAIVVMAVGARYVALFESVRAQFERYAEACGADLVVVAEPPDPAGRRNILCQKMLLADRCRDWDRVAILDIDVMIAPAAQSIFTALPDGAGLAAVVDARGTPAFENLVRQFWQLPEILAETHESYFSSRGFPPFPDGTPVIASINGGALLCRPALVADLFRGVYAADFEMQAVGGAFVKRDVSGNEEALMAYHAQARGLFVPLPERFNYQFLLALMTDPAHPAARWPGSLGYRVLKRLDDRVALPPSAYPQAWRDLVAATLARVDILHFAGGFPFRGLVRG